MNKQKVYIRLDEDTYNYIKTRAGDVTSAVLALLEERQENYLSHLKWYSIEERSTQHLTYLMLDKDEKRDLLAAVKAAGLKKHRLSFYINVCLKGVK